MNKPLPHGRFLFAFETYEWDDAPISYAEYDENYPTQVHRTLSSEKLPERTTAGNSANDSKKNTRRVVGARSVKLQAQPHGAREIINRLDLLYPASEIMGTAIASSQENITAVKDSRISLFWLLHHASYGGILLPLAAVQRGSELQGAAFRPRHCEIGVLPEKRSLNVRSSDRSLAVRSPAATHGSRRPLALRASEWLLPAGD